MALVPWSDQEKRAFLDMQFNAQRTDHEHRFPNGEHSIILREGSAIGRVWVHQDDREVRLIDIALLPEHRTQGIGTELVRGLQDRAVATELPLRHSVFKTNEGALRFYRRLGFEVLQDFEMYVLMEWTP